MAVTGIDRQVSGQVKLGGLCLRGVAGSDVISLTLEQFHSFRSADTLSEENIGIQAKFLKKKN